MERTRLADRSEYWRARIAEQEGSGLPVARFCKDQGISEQSFYVWRKRLRNEGPVRFALVETGPGQQQPDATSALELILPGGERLRIGAAVNPNALRTVLEALRK
jgi:transposase-like protein